ncbi:MAG: hypothetical protein SP4CHLAM5_05250 [Chlamydiia bacterium]|nr:hypothetical protein [Chlamydiia bacterium]MCH9618396.1 hypothetical protein [Chlamydiia bacterium]MCH9624286.1 hypothetical protein [Chlamydiia bacterium]
MNSVLSRLHNYLPSIDALTEQTKSEIKEISNSIKKITDVVITVIHIIIGPNATTSSKEEEIGQDIPRINIADIFKTEGTLLDQCETAKTNLAFAFNTPSFEEIPESVQKIFEECCHIMQCPQKNSHVLMAKKYNQLGCTDLQNERFIAMLETYSQLFRLYRQHPDLFT